MLSWCPNFTFHCMLLMQPYHYYYQHFVLSSLPHMPPSQGLMYEFGVLIECNGIPLNFSPCFTAEYLPPPQPTFTRRTSDHCLGTFLAVNLALAPSPPNFKCSVSHYPPNLSLSLSFRLQRVKHLDSLLVKTRDASSVPAPHVPVYRGRLWHTHISLPRTQKAPGTAAILRYTYAGFPIPSRQTQGHNHYFLYPIQLIIH
jgi:hypothetical protein